MSSRLAEELRGAELRYRLLMERRGHRPLSGAYRAAALRRLGR